MKSLRALLGHVRYRRLSPSDEGATPMEDRPLLSNEAPTSDLVDIPRTERDVLPSLDGPFYHSLSGSLAISDILLNVLFFVEADLATLLAMSLVSHGWLERVERLPQWRALAYHSLSEGAEGPHATNTDAAWENELDGSKPLPITPFSHLGRFVASFARRHTPAVLLFAGRPFVVATRDAYVTACLGARRQAVEERANALRAHIRRAGFGLVCWGALALALLLGAAVGAAGHYLGHFTGALAAFFAIVFIAGCAIVRPWTRLSHVDRNIFSICLQTLAVAAPSMIPMAMHVARLRELERHHDDDVAIARLRRSVLLVGAGILGAFVLLSFPVFFLTYNASLVNNWCGMLRLVFATGWCALLLFVITCTWQEDTHDLSLVCDRGSGIVGVIAIAALVACVVVSSCKRSRNRA